MEGRALDWMISGKAEKANAKAFIAWLSADDAAGNHYAMARRMGIMYIVWNNEMFRFYDTARGWAEYNGCYVADVGRPTTRRATATTCTSPSPGTARPRRPPTGAARPSSRRAVPRRRPSARRRRCPRPGSSSCRCRRAGSSTPPQPSASPPGAGSARTRWTGEDRRIDLQVSGRGGVPASGATAAILSIQVKGPNAPTKLYVEPTGSTTAAAARLDHRHGGRRAGPGDRPARLRRPGQLHAVHRRRRPRGGRARATTASPTARACASTRPIRFACSTP